VTLDGQDEDISGVAAWDAGAGRLAVILVNFRDRYALRRKVRLTFKPLPARLRGGRWRESVVDATHCNAWHELSGAELSELRSGRVSGESFGWEQTLAANSVTLLEFTADD
jgi:hypothetical protein